MSTIKDVAKLAGVGLGTASRVINNSGSVSEKTKDKVLDAIEKLNYVPNETARAFVKQKNSIVALFLPSIHHMFFSKLAYYIEDELSENGYKLMLCNSGGHVEKEISYIQMLKQNKVSGIIGISYNEIEDYIDKSMPIVLLDRQLDEKIPYVTSDNYKGGKIAYSKLKSTGCKNVAYVGTFTNKIQTEVAKRRQGFLDEANINKASVIDYVGEDPIIDANKFVSNFFDQYGYVDGIFAESDMMALMILKEAQKRNINVPNQLSIVGYDGVSSYFGNENIVSTIQQPVEAMGRSLVRMVLRRIEGEIVKPIIHDITFVSGETTKK